MNDACYAKKTNILHNLEIFIEFTPQKSDLEFELTVRIY